MELLLVQFWANDDHWDAVTDLTLNSIGIGQLILLAAPLLQKIRFARRRYHYILCGFWLTIFDLMNRYQIWLVICCQWEWVVQGWFWCLLQRRQLAAAQGGRCPRRGRSRAGRARAGSTAPARSSLFLPAQREHLQIYSFLGVIKVKIKSAEKLWCNTHMCI